MFKDFKKRAGELSGKAKDVKSNLSEQIADRVPGSVKEHAENLSTSLSEFSETVGDIYDSQLEKKETYCSWCFEKHTCSLYEKGGLSRNVYKKKKKQG